MESHLTKAVSYLESGDEMAGVQKAVQELRSCETELVARRFARARAADGRVMRVRVPAVDAALIYVSRALSLVGEDEQLQLMRENVEHAREEVSHINA